MFDLQAFIRDVLEQNADALAAHFHPDACILWHCTNEKFTVPEYIRANCEYPGSWAGEIELAERMEDRVFAVVHVYAKDRSSSHHVTSLIHLKGSRIASLEEYWADDGPAPDWRKAMKIGTPICVDPFI